MSHLKYNIVEVRLYGKVEDLNIDTFAVSGGRAGSKKKGASNWLLENNWTMTFVKKTKTNSGGPLPLGKYYLKKHESRENWIRLVPLKATDMGNRAGMAIHGRGPRGSDGCIVPYDFQVIKNLLKVLEKIKYKPILDVIAVGDLSSFRV